MQISSFIFSVRKNSFDFFFFPEFRNYLKHYLTRSVFHPQPEPCRFVIVIIIIAVKAYDPSAVPYARCNRNNVRERVCRARYVYKAQFIILHTLSHDKSLSETDPRVLYNNIVYFICCLKVTSIGPFCAIYDGKKRKGGKKKKKKKYTVRGWATVLRWNVIGNSLVKREIQFVSVHVQRTNHG